MKYGRDLLSLGLSLIPVIGLGLYIHFDAGNPYPVRTPAAAADASGPELSIYPHNEAFSLPDRGTSLFDKIFSETSKDGVRQYKIPYPFQRVVAQLQHATGGVAPIQTLFPMGRSLQRVAAIAGMKDVPNTDPFFRYPRLVLGFDQESVNSATELNLNLKGRLYIGMNEKAQLMEVISYNDEAGRFEYQVVRDYNSAGRSSVVYANRQVCLTCHQNQTPIFSQGPWKESNANPAMSDGMMRVLRSQVGEKPCDGTDQLFCVGGNGGRYFGAPVSVDISAPQGLDQSTKLANEFHAYHKMWQRLCPDLDCRKQLLKQILLYKLIDQNTLLLTPDLQKLNALLASRWQKEFPRGLALPDSSVPNRDPLLNVNERGREDLSVIQGKAAPVKSALEQVFALGNIPGEFEPAKPRAPMTPAWNSAFLPGDIALGGDASSPGVARLIAGYADFFTAADARDIDRILISQPAKEIESIPTDCTFQKSASAGVSIKCSLTGKGRISFSTFLRPRPGDSNQDPVGTVSSLRVLSSTCDQNIVASPMNLAQGKACFQASALRGWLHSDGTTATLTLTTSAGLSVRLLDGRRMGPISFALPPAGVSVTAPSPILAQAPVLRDLAPLGDALERAYQTTDASADKTGDFKRFVDGPALNRNTVMAMLMRFLGKPHERLFNITKEMQSLKRVSEAPDDELLQLNGLKPLDRTLALTMHTCGACHYNRDNVPPAYLGGPTETLSLKERCQRLATCAPRMLYRLKMWECPPSDYTNKKSPMPPLGRFKTLNIDPAFWITHDRVQLFQALQVVFPKNELPSYLVQQGIADADARKITSELQTLGCETQTSDVFEKLPRCDNKLPLSTTLCQ